MHKPIINLLLIITVAFSVTAQQQQVVEKPTAILFMLHISTNKIEALQKRGLTDDVKDVIETDHEINNSIVRDFEKNFKYCPVYFFYDTQLNFVQLKQWDKVNFFDFEHYKSNKKIEISGISDYIIAEVNYPPLTEFPTVDEKGKVIKPEYTVEYAAARDYGIICYDENYKLLRNKLQYNNISLRRIGNMFDKKSLYYRFVGALAFEERLKKYYGTKPQ